MSENTVSENTVAELAKTYDYLAGLDCYHTEWKTRRWEQAAGIGKDILSDCQIDLTGKCMTSVLESITDGLYSDENSSEYQCAMKACLLIQELYRCDASIQKVLNKAFASREAILVELHKVQNEDLNYTIRDVLIADRTDQEKKGLRPKQCDEAKAKQLAGAQTIYREQRKQKR